MNTELEKGQLDAILTFSNLAEQLVQTKKGRVLFIISDFLHQSLGLPRNAPFSVYITTDEKVQSMHEGLRRFMAGYKAQANVSFVGPYVAQEKGYYREQNLDVEIRHSAQTGEDHGKSGDEHGRPTTTTTTTHAPAPTGVTDDHGGSGVDHGKAGELHGPTVLQAACLRVKLRYLEKWNAARRQHAGRYRFLFEKSRIVTPNEALYAESVWHLYVVRVSHRDTFKDYLSSRGIHCGIHYPVPVHLQPAYHDLGHKRGDFPVTEDYAQRIISLPMYAELTPELIARVAEAAVEFVDGTRSSVVGTMAPEPPRATTTLP